MRVLFLAFAICCLFAFPAQARAHHAHHHGHHRYVQQHYDGVDMQQQWIFWAWQQPVEQPSSGGRRYGGDEIVSHPSGCPRVAFCGCGASERVFGHPVRSLWLAANWLRFPRTVAAAGMAAVFGRHHVAIIERVNGDGTAVLYDANSGSHLTRIHTRSIAGAIIVNPRGA